MANRLLAYRVTMELEKRRRRGNRSLGSVVKVARRLLVCLARHSAAGGERSAEPAGWSDYDLAVRARVSERQTRELYEEIGLGALVREALDLLVERGLVRVERRNPSGPYRGFAATPDGLASVDLRPWWRRALAFFDPPAGVVTDREPKQ